MTRAKTAMSEIQELKQQHLADQMAAQYRGDRKYQGQDCKALHGGIRYAANGRCVECMKVHDMSRAVRDRRHPKEACEQIASSAPRPNPTPPISAWVSCITPLSKAQLMAGRAP